MSIYEDENILHNSSESDISEDINNSYSHDRNANTYCGQKHINLLFSKIFHLLHPSDPRIYIRQSALPN